MALLALASSSLRKHPQWKAPLLAIGVFGASLFYGDAVLTPAISVLSAVEGLEVGTAVFKPYILPISVGIIVAPVSLSKAWHPGYRRYLWADLCGVVCCHRGRRYLEHF